MIPHSVKKSNPDGERFHLNQILKDLDEIIAGISIGAGVTSVGQTVPIGFTVVGSPVTSTGTLAINYAAGYLGYTALEAAKLSALTVLSFGNTFETVSRNLEAGNATFTYSMGRLTSIAYAVAAGTVTKTFNYTGPKLTSIVLSGDTPAGVDLTKTFGYTVDTLTSVTYS